MKRVTNEKIAELHTEIVSEEIITEEIKEKDIKILDAQNQMMEELIIEAAEHGDNNGAVNLLKDATKTEEQGILKRMSIQVFEPLINNMFIVSFPKEFEIDGWVVKSIGMPIITRNRCTDTIVVFRKLEPLISKTIINLVTKKNFDIDVKLLDKTGKSVENWGIRIKKTISVDFGGKLDYSDDGISEIKVTFKTKDCILKD